MMKPNKANDARKMKATSAAPQAQVANGQTATEQSAGGRAATRVKPQAKRDEAVQAQSGAKPSWWSARGKKERVPAPTRRDSLELLPIRNPGLEWEEIKGQVVLHIKRESNLKTRLISLFLPIPASRDVVLDALGTHVWKQLDGATTVENISKSLAREFKLLPREAELSLRQFFQELGRRGYVGFMKTEP